MSFSKPFFRAAVAFVSLFLVMDALPDGTDTVAPFRHDLLYASDDSSFQPLVEFSEKLLAALDRNREETNAKKQLLTEQVKEAAGKAKDSAQKQGNLDAVLLFSELVENPDATPNGNNPQLAKLLKSRSAAQAKIEESHRQGQAKLLQAAVASLEKMKVDQTKAGNIALAKEIAAYQSRVSQLTAMRPSKTEPIRPSPQSTRSPASSQHAYLVIDLSGGANAVRYPVAYLAASPPGGFNTDEYKTTKLVLKRIEAGSFKMGENQDASVTLTKPFFIGLFEVTQKQWQLVTGGNPSNFSGDKLPAEKISYDAIRGSSNGALWPSSNAVDSSSFLGKLRARTGLDFDLPTEAQWEYACRAGTTTTYSYGNSANGNYMWYPSNSSAQTHDVGMKQPNPWGLYDMHGNVREWCLDWHDSSLGGGTDPKGSSSGSRRVGRGGSWYYNASYCTSFFRGHDGPSKENKDHGFRLTAPIKP